MSVRIQLKQFEGPLDVLLYLIRKHEMNIMDINIHEITSQYLAYIQRMKELNLDLAGDFISMAASLIQIKSKMILPREELEEEEELEDPRQNLVKQLLEYEKYKKAASGLYVNTLLGRDTWLRGNREKKEELPEAVLIVKDLAPLTLGQIYFNKIKNIKKQIYKVTAPLQGVSDRIRALLEIFSKGTNFLFSKLLQGQSKIEKRNSGLISFLSILEMVKLGAVSASQEVSSGEIYLTHKKTLDAEFLSKLEGSISSAN
ncbi:MAG: segregation/condensation protein A [Bdellovibrionaceae bacterium]|nr:segregation/condensation protein A [Pseudobdellovibrionaceae bacterium]